MKDTTFRNTKTFSEQQEDYKPVRIGNFCNDNIRCESNGDRNKNLPVKEYLINRIPEYLNKIKPYLWDIIIILMRGNLAHNLIINLMRRKFG